MLSSVHMLSYKGIVPEFMENSYNRATVKDFVSQIENM